MKANKGLIVGLVVGALVIAGVGAFAMNAMKGPPKPNYLTDTAKMGDVESAVLATGALQPADVVNVGSQTSGQIVSMGVKLGDEVKSGQLLANIDPTNLNNQVRQQETQVAQAQAQVNSVRANLTLTQSTLSRNQLLAEKGAGTQAQVDQSVAQLAATQANLTQQENNLRNQELNLDNARNNLDRANIRSPIDGIIAEVVSHVGQTINTNQTVPIIVKVAKMDVMTVRTQVSEADIIKVQPGQKVYFTILGEPGRRYYATLRDRELTPAGGVLDPNGGVQKGAIYYNVLFEVPNPDRVLFPAMTAEVHIVLAEAKNVLTIPSVALGPKGPDNRQTVKVVQPDGSLVERRVQVGVNNNFKAEIKDGLKAGDKVVIGEALPTSGAPAAAASGQPLFGAVAAPKQ